VKKYLLIIWALIIVIALGVTGFFVAKKVFVPKQIHIHAGFVVFEHNKKIDFSDFKYMSVKPCSLKEEEKLTDEELQSEKGHLHDNVGDVVHVHRVGSRWRELFTNIKYPLDYSKTTGYINGQEVPDWQDQKVEAYQSLVVFIGENDKKHLKEAVKKSHIQLIEKKSENCGTPKK
jgi:hypothetical protein